MSGIIRITLTHCPKCKQQLPEPIETWRRERLKSGVERNFSLSGTLHPTGRKRKVVVPTGTYDVRADVSISFS